MRAVILFLLFICSIAKSEQHSHGVGISESILFSKKYLSLVSSGEKQQKHHYPGQSLLLEYSYKLNSKWFLSLAYSLSMKPEQIYNNTHEVVEDFNFGNAWGLGFEYTYLTTQVSESNKLSFNAGIGGLIAESSFLAFHKVIPAIRLGANLISNLGSFFALEIGYAGIPSIGTLFFSFGPGYHF